MSPKTWYGMPASAKDGKVVCFFQSGQKFKSRYAGADYKPCCVDRSSRTLLNTIRNVYLTGTAGFLSVRVMMGF